METIINKIIEIDRQAEERLNQAENKKNEISIITKNECKNLETKLYNDAEKRIAEIERINRDEFEKISESLTKEYADKMKNMDIYFEKNHENIENKMFNEIVGEVV